MPCNIEKTVGLYTLGCKVAQYETEAIAEEFQRLGFRVLDFSETCDVYVINTCTVTAESDRKCRQIIRRAVRANPEGLVIVLGCYSQRSPEEVAAIPGVGCVLGSADKMKVPRIALRMLRGEAPAGTGNIYVKDIDSEPFEPMRISRGPRTRVYVKIEDGCESRCSYCAIPSARGKVRSKPMEQVIEEVEALRDSGVREVVLTGIETGSWGRDLSGELDLGDLLRELDRRGSAERIRLGSLAPELMGESFARKTCDLKILAPHFHISVQSGSDNVLRAMRRRYNSATALENIMRLRALIPEAQFTTDLMVGFPGETEEDFQKTREFLERAQFIDTHVFAYSRRRNTPAAFFEGQIPEQVKRRRSEELIKAAEQVRDRVLDRIIARGEPLPCIFESQKCKVWFAHSHNFAAVAVRTEEVDLAGESRLVTPLYREGGMIYGEIKK